MTEPHKQTFQMPNGKEITSIVLDKTEFDQLIDGLKGIMIGDTENQRAAQTQLDAIKAANTLPMISRGTKTQYIFEKYEIETNLACFIVRGTGKQLERQLIEQHGLQYKHRHSLIHNQTNPN